MSSPLPRTIAREITLNNGTALGMSHRWEGGQYCSLLTAAGIVGCGIYDIQTSTVFGQAIAIAKGTPERPLVEPEDLFEARIVDCTPQARSFGITTGMTGREAVELMLLMGRDTAVTSGSTPVPTAADTRGQTSDSGSTSAAPIRVQHIDHVTLVVKDLEASRAFYVGALGMQEVPRPSFGFAGLWFQAGTTQIHLILEHAESGPARIFVPEQCSISRTHHFAFEVNDAQATLARLSELGIPLADGPKQRPDGPTQLYIHDPDGNLVELFSLDRRDTA